MSLSEYFKKKRVEKQRIKELEQKHDAQEAQKKFDQGSRLLNLKEYDAARDDFIAALEIYPHADTELHLSLLHSLALTFFNKQDYKEAILYFDKCLSLGLAEEKKCSSYLYKGISLIKKDKNPNSKVRKSALECFNKCIEIDESDADGWYMKGCVEFELGNTAESIKCFDRVIGLDSNYENAYNVSLFFEVKKEKEKEKAFEEKELVAKHDSNISGIPEEILKIGMPRHEPKKSKSENTDEAVGTDKEMFITKSGLKVSTIVEQRIANFLADKNYEHHYRPSVSWSNSHDLIPMFYLPKFNLYMEHFDVSTESAKSHADWKISLFKDRKKKLVYTNTEDEICFEENLNLKLKQFLSKMKNIKK